MSECACVRVSRLVPVRVRVCACACVYVHVCECVFGCLRERKKLEKSFALILRQYIRHAIELTFRTKFLD